MLGPGETETEVNETIDDVYATGCQILTIGQYLKLFSIAYGCCRIHPPGKFENYREMALTKGFKIIKLLSVPLFMLKNR